MPAFTVADNIRAEMARRRVLQSDLATLLDLHIQSVSKRLMGEVRFRDVELAKIAEYFGVEVSSLFRESA